MDCDFSAFSDQFLTHKNKKGYVSTTDLHKPLELHECSNHPPCSRISMDLGPSLVARDRAPSDSRGAEMSNRFGLKNFLSEYGWESGPMQADEHCRATLLVFNFIVVFCSPVHTMYGRYNNIYEHWWNNNFWVQKLIRDLLKIIRKIKFDTFWEMSHDYHCFPVTSCDPRHHFGINLQFLGKRIFWSKTDQHMHRNGIRSSQNALWQAFDYHSKCVWCCSPLGNQTERSLGPLGVEYRLTKNGVSECQKLIKGISKIPLEMKKNLLDGPRSIFPRSRETISNTVYRQLAHLLLVV